VIVSAYGDMENIRTAMNRGAFDFVTKPIDFNDLEITIRKTLKHIETMQNALESRDRLVAITRELEVATQVQMSILPRDRSHSETHEIQAMMIPAREIGGDFYNYFSLDDALIGLIIADVSGKGIPAALFTMVTQTLLKGAVRNFASPARCLSEVNELLAEDNESCVFVTVFYGILDLRDGSFRYCNGGHNPPRLVRGDSGVEMLPTTGNVVLGVFPGHGYVDGEVQLNPGDTLFLYTDGISEAQNARNEEFGEERLDEKLTSLKQATARDVVNEVVDAVHLFVEDTPQSDDITCIALRFNAMLSA
jgi:sigma-B regulation protein RsbU (phosphoserine phosphatase)